MYQHLYWGFRICVCLFFFFSRPLSEDVYVYLHGDDTDELAINTNMPRLPSLDQVNLQESVTAGELTHNLPVLLGVLLVDYLY